MRINIKLIILSVILIFINLFGIINSFAKQNSECISISENECARHKDGSPQKCKDKGEEGICVEINNKCKCISLPRDCSEYEQVYPLHECYESDGTNFSCPVGKIITINYGIIAGEIYCCCREKFHKNRDKNDAVEGKQVLQGSDSLDAIP